MLSLVSVDFRTIVHPLFCCCTASGLGGYELGLGALRWVYEKARVDEEAAAGRGTGFGLVAVDDVRDEAQEFEMVD